MSSSLSLQEDHDVISLSSKPFGSLPLFLPGNFVYDPTTNTIREKTPTKKKNDESRTDKENNANHINNNDEHLAKEEEEKDNNNDTSSQLVLVPEAGMEMLEQLEDTSGGISAIACLGPYRTGKSLLMSRFFPDRSSSTTTTAKTQSTSETAFEIGPTLEGCTRGIWISTTALKCKRSGTIKVVLDCEGMGDPSSGSSASNSGGTTHDVRIALTCLLISSVFLFNNTSHPDRGSLHFLQYLQTLRQRLPPSSRTDFPSFVWVFRDYFLQMPLKPNNNNNNNNDIPPEPYTLKEYILERVLAPAAASNSNHRGGPEGEIADSLLHDFASFHALAVRYPQRKDGTSFAPDEMAHLGKIPFEDLQDEFQQEIHTVVLQCLEEARPFQLAAGKDYDNGGTSKKNGRKNEKKGWGGLLPFGNNNDKSGHKSRFPSGSLYAKWLDTVQDLVNSDANIPNLPDIQHQLLQKLANEQVHDSVEKYEQAMKEYMDASPVFNNIMEDDHGSDATKLHQTNDFFNSTLRAVLPTNKNERLTESAIIPITAEVGGKFKNLIDSQKLAGVAEVDELIQTSQHVSQQLHQDLENTVPNGSILSQALATLERQTTDQSNKTSALTLWLAENRKRSRASCEALSVQMYSPVQSAIRSDPGAMSVSDFQVLFHQLLSSFKSQARGPAADEIVESFWKQKGDADQIFLEKVSESNLMYEEAIAREAQLQTEVKAKASELATLAQDLDRTKKQMEKEVSELNAQHQQRLKQTMAEQKKKEEALLASLRADMENQLKEAEARIQKERNEREASLKQLESEAESRLASEIEAREERLRKEQEAYQAELDRVRALADEALQKKMMEAEAQRRTEQAKLEESMKKQLEQVENAKQRELSEKEMALAEVKKEIEQKEIEKTAMQKRAEEAESRFACRDICCIL